MANQASFLALFSYVGSHLVSMLDKAVRFLMNEMVKTHTRVRCDKNHDLAVLDLVSVYVPLYVLAWCILSLMKVNHRKKAVVAVRVSRVVVDVVLTAVCFVKNYCMHRRYM